MAISIYATTGLVAESSFLSDTTTTQLNTPWVDSTLNALTLDEKLSQLFIIQAQQELDNQLIEKIQDLQPAGILLKDLSLHSYITSINKLRRNPTIPLLEVSDQTVSLHNQFKDLPKLPTPATLSAINDTPLKEALQDQLLADITTLGINCSFAPNIHFHQSGEQAYSDLNNEANPSAIFRRASNQVAALNDRKTLSILQGLKWSFVYDESFPKQFSYLKHNGLSGILLDDQILNTDHLSEKGPEFLKNYLQDELHFEGLIIGKLSPKATFIDYYWAGADAFVVPIEEVDQVLKQLKQLVNQNIIDIKRIEEKVRKILLLKADLDLPNQQLASLDRDKVIARLYPTPESHIEKLYEKSGVIIPSQKHALPLPTTYGLNRHIIHVSHEKLSTLQRTAFEFVNSTPHLYRPKKENGIINPLAFEGKDKIYLIAIDHIDLSTEKNKIFLNSIYELAKENEVAIINFGNPLNLNLFSEDFTQVQLFEKNKKTERLAIQLLYGSAKASGSMPVGISTQIPYAFSHTTQINRLRRTTPEKVGMNSEELYRIDEIVDQAIRQRAIPGCQVLVAKAGHIVYSKSFGHHTYEMQHRVERSDVYDVASVTKAAATTLAMMKLQEDGMASIDEKIGNQMSLPAHSSLKNITLKQFLIHKSGLQKNMPISPYLNKRNGTDCTTYFCNTQTEAHSQKIADQIYFNPQYQMDIWKAVNRLDLPNKYRYRKFLYSDVNFYILQQFIEATTGMGLDEYVNEQFYKPLGLRYCLYNPLNRFPKYMIVPTQDDQKWRNTLVQGTVHDETAALHSGIGGNAGLFSNAEDLAILFQMLLNGGNYGGKEYLQSKTIKYFTTAKHGNHRGLGFDMPLQTSTISSNASASTFGHNGFTGTCVWVDPENQLIYIFLANRIHPEVHNRALSKLGVRRKIHDAIYNAIDRDFTREETILVNLSGRE